MINKIVYLNSVSLDNACLETLQQLRLQQYQSAGLKKLNGHQIWSVRTSDAGRLLLTQIKFQGEVSWLVLEYLPNHEYDAARFLKPNVLQRFLEDNHAVLKAIEEEHFKAVDADEDVNDKKIITTSPLHRVYYYNREYLSLSHAQQDVLQQPLPFVISGMPGSGKTCIGFAMIEKYMQQNIGVSFQILYLCLSETLANNMRKLWCDANPDLLSQVKFVSLREFIERDPLVATFKTVQEDEFLRWYKSTGLAYDATSVYEEFKCIAVTKTVEEYIEQSGTRNSLFHVMDDKKCLFGLYQRYATFLNENKFIDIYFYQYNSQQRYDFIFVDEAQNLSHIQLRYLLQSAKEQQICFAMDTNQNMQKGVSTRPYLLQLISQYTHKKVDHFNLLQTYRNPAIVVELANSVLLVKNALVGGVADSNEYTQAVAQPDSGTQGNVQWFDTASNDLIAIADSPRCAIVVNSLVDKQRAFEIFSSPLIFTREEIQGLQFDIIILFEPLGDKIFEQINKALPDDLNSHVIKPFRPKNKTDQSALPFVQSLNALYTSITRSCHSVLIFSKQTHQIAKIQTYLKQATANFNNSPTSSIVTKSTDADWEAKARELEEYNKIDQADAIYRLKLKRSRGQNKTSMAQSTSSNSTSTNSTSSETSTTDIVDNYIKRPTVAGLKTILTSANWQKLVYTRNKDGVAIIEAVKKNFNFYAASFLKVEETRLISMVIFKDPNVQKQVTLSRVNFYSDTVFGKYCSSETGATILMVNVLNSPYLENDLIHSTQNQTFFWEHAADLLRTDAGEELFDKLNQVNTHSKVMKKKTLFANDLFQLLCQDDKKAEILHDIVISHPLWLNDFDLSVLLNPVYRGYNAFSMLCAHQTGLKILILIFTANPRFYQQIQAEHLLAQDHYWVNQKTREVAYKTPTSTFRCQELLKMNDVVMTPFHRITVNLNSQFINFLYDLFLKSPSIIESIKINDFFEKITFNTPSKVYSPFNYMVSLPEGIRLWNLVITKRHDILMSFPIADIFSAPVLNVVPLIKAPSPMDYLVKPENALVLFQMLKSRRDLAKLLCEFIISNTHYVMSNLTKSDVGRQLIQFLLNENKQNLENLVWPEFAKSHQGVELDSKKMSIFHYLIQTDPNLLFSLCEINPYILMSIPVASLLELCLQDKMSTPQQSKPYSAFMWLCSCERGQKIIIDLQKKMPNLYTQIDDYQLYHEQSLIQESMPNTSAFENLCMNPVGMTILRNLLDAKPGLLTAIPESMLSKFVLSKLPGEKDRAFPLVFHMSHSEIGCALMLYLIMKKPTLINEHLAKSFIFEINNTQGAERIYVYALMLAHQSGRTVLDHIQKNRPDLSQFFTQMNSLDRTLQNNDISSNSQQI